MWLYEPQNACEEYLVGSDAETIIQTLAHTHGRISSIFNPVLETYAIRRLSKMGERGAYIGRIFEPRRV